MNKRKITKGFAILGIMSVGLISQNTLVFANLDKSITNPQNITNGWALGTDNHWRYWKNGNIAT